MHGTVNAIVVVFSVWLLSFLEDVWFNKLLKYQLEGEAEKRNKRSSLAVKSFEEKCGRFDWMLLAVGLTLSIGSVSEMNHGALSLFILVSGLSLCVSYLAIKIKNYSDALKELR